MERQDPKLRQGHERRGVMGHLEAASPACLDTVVTPDPSHTVSPAVDPFCLQRLLHLACAVCLARSGVHAPYMGGQRSILRLACTRSTIPPGVVAAATDTQGTTHANERELAGIAPHELLLHGSSLAKYAAALF